MVHENLSLLELGVPILVKVNKMVSYFLLVCKFIKELHVLLEDYLDFSIYRDAVHNGFRLEPLLDAAEVVIIKGDLHSDHVVDLPALKRLEQRK